MIAKIIPIIIIRRYKNFFISFDHSLSDTGQTEAIVHTLAAYKLRDICNKIIYINKLPIIIETSG